ncbi:hyaluronoglucosaminidase [Micromonospora pallida]|uniref:Hyaluronoglucosaminidase n=1 Tax=Micromonospora pallida TaxID=145854 RepID=A0A1C6SIA1_9ACTN|nr:beta-N-acetylglucosaminidase domain-containing protein [Micromonospora pallida]SCL29128.1 hyaluronoglucosaminidase [Micromonospora pallida]
MRNGYLRRRWRFPRTLAGCALASLVGTVGLLGSPSTASGAPATPPLNPRPQELSVTGTPLDLPAAVTIVRGTAADQPAVDAVVAAFTSRDTRVTLTSTDPGAGTTVYVGGAQETPASAAALNAIGVATPSGLPDQGYLLATGTDSGGRQRVVLSGGQKVGTFYAAQTLRQLLTSDSSGAAIARVTIRDWPAFSFRGGMDSANPPPPGVARWTKADRLEQVEVLARNKMNRFFYGPAADPRTGGSGSDNWRTSYSATELGDLREVVSKANSLHVAFVYRISPEMPLDQASGICHSSATERGTLLSRLNQMYQIGVRHFVIAWDDVFPTRPFSCVNDSQTYGTGVTAWARAQADVTNFVQAQFINAHAGMGQLYTVSSEYAGTAVSSYRTEFDTRLSTAVGVYWTGPEVLSPRITKKNLDDAQVAFPRHRLAIWDNFPVNDQVWDRLQMGPLVGREAALSAAPGILFNEMTQQGPSQLPLLTAADFAWNPGQYQPEDSWSRAIDVLGGSKASQLRTFAEINRSSVIDRTDSVALADAISSFRNALRTGTGVDSAAAALKQRLSALRTASTDLQATQTSLTTQAQPWLQQTVRLVDAATRAVDLLTAERAGQTTVANTLRQEIRHLLPTIASHPESVAHGVLHPLVTFALRLGVDRVDLSGDGRADVLAVTGNGTLNAYENLRTTLNWPELGATQTVGQGWSTSQLPVIGDLDGDRRADLLSVTSTGALVQFRNTGSFTGGMFATGVQVGSGWQGTLAAYLADLDDDGRADLLGVFPGGTLRAFRNTGMSNGAVTWGPAVQVGQGWSTAELPFFGDLTGDGKADLMSVKSDGSLWHFLNTGSFSEGTFAAGQRVGAGWSGHLAMHVVDLDGDGPADVLGVLADGTLAAFRNQGVTNGLVGFGPRTSVGQGWHANMLPYPTDLSGDGRADLISINGEGRLFTNINSGRFVSGLMFPTTAAHGPGWGGTIFLR